jgi:hypothetical protein
MMALKVHTAATAARYEILVATGRLRATSRLYKACAEPDRSCRSAGDASRRARFALGK